MKEIIELNGRLRRELGNCFCDGVLMLGRDDQPEEFKRLPVKFRQEIEALRRKINAAMPDDFSYMLSLGDDSADLHLEYDNGPQVKFGRSHEWDQRRSVIDQLTEFDWETERQQAIAGTEVFDEMIAHARHAPAELPSTKEIQKAFREEMKEFITSKRRDSSNVWALMWREDESLREERFESLDSFRRDLPDLMTVRYLIIAVVSTGKSLSREEIDRFKTEALKELEESPISHAKALGKL
jgi:hypothetical protein